MKKIIPYLLFSVTTLHTILGGTPVMAASCGLHTEKTKAVCEEIDTDCQEKISASTKN